MVQWGVAFVLLLLLIPASATGQTAAEIEAAFWRSVACESGPEVELYLEIYPTGAYAAAAYACLEGQLGLDRATWKLIQRGLAAVGHDPGSADGLSSPQTRSAIWAWQKAKGLAETGYVTGEQAEALMAMGRQVVRNEELEGQLGLDRATRELIQRGLAAVGHDPGSVDGLFGRATRAAVQQWQRDNGEQVTGYVTRTQAESLQAQGEEAKEEERRAQEEEQAREAAAQRDLDRKIKELSQREHQLALNICEDILSTHVPNEADDEEWEESEAEAAKEAFRYTDVMHPPASTQAGRCGHDAWHDLRRRIVQCHKEYFADRDFLRGPARSRFRKAMAARMQCGERDDEYDRALRECCEQYVPLPGS